VNEVNNAQTGLDGREEQEWIESLDYVLHEYGPAEADDLIHKLSRHLARSGGRPTSSRATPYVNTIPADREAPYPGSIEIERRIKSLVRWNAMAMVVRANRESPGIGGHISTYASAATLLEVGFNHFFRAHDQLYMQGHAAPGVYARAYLEGRLSIERLENFRRELQAEQGLPSYPHPWLMPDFWQFPTVSMGLAPLMAIYQARFNRYLEHRGLADTSDSRVWCLIGDGECDEPETLGGLSLAAREGLDNLTMVVNCNLQRLDGPVRGNQKVIQELEALFRGAGWNVIKVIWGSDWDPLLAADTTGRLVERMEACVDGDYQKYSVESGEYIREHFFGEDPALRELASDLSDEQLKRLRRGGHDPRKVYAAYKAAVEHEGRPTVVLAKTIKGYGLGEAGEGRNVTHQQKKLNEEELVEFRSRFGVPLGDDEVGEAPFYRPEDDSREIRYLNERREQLGGFVPRRDPECEALQAPKIELIKDLLEGSGEREASTMMAFARVLSKLLKDDRLGDLIVPIIPDEARTFGLDALFRQAGIYTSNGQRYDPVDQETLLYYRESTDGQILEEGITEAGSMASFIAAGTAYATHSVNTIPLFIHYSMFGYQRVGDLIWAAAESQARGFLVGGTAGRTTLSGEGLQHQDGQSPLLMSVVPTARVYDPAYAYELAIIIRDGLRAMYQHQEQAIYYLTVYNEPYEQPPEPEDVRDGIIAGLYSVRRPETETKDAAKVHLFGSGAILNEAVRAGELLEERHDVAPVIWSATSYSELQRNCLDTDRWNLRHPSRKARKSFLQSQLGDEAVPVIAATDYVKAVPGQIARWVPGTMTTLGTDGFGRSDDRAALRHHFEISAEHIAAAALATLSRDGTIDSKVAAKAIKDFDIDPEAVNPLYA